ncbi:MAG TPA: ATP-dependent DNA helicase RecG [Mesorhizobium sp.]|jgi:ATP-dependent DNA helicase RecG|nr:ATP-dependent DNA helicase RecG [Mesorhizobium sp.]
MRPSLLDPLFAPVTSLSGVGEKVAALIDKVVSADLGGRHARVSDLLFTPPFSVIDRRLRPGIALAPEGAIVTLDVRIDRHQAPPPGKSNSPYRVFAHDETGEIALTFFRAQPQWLEKLMPVGEKVVVSGRMEWFNGRPTMVHPDHIARAEEAARLPLVEPVYRMTAGLSAKVLRRAIDQAVERVPALPEWISAEAVVAQTFEPFRAALDRLHHPQDVLDADPNGAAWKRLAFDELLAGQLSLGLVRGRTRRLGGRPARGDGRLVNAIRAALPYSLTGAQEQALREINGDLAAPTRMLRLLQGDVGAGKTVVALLSMARAAEAGRQSALMAPTEILARQHFSTLAPLAEKAGLRLAILSGREQGRARAETLAGLERGDIHMVVGTHALFQEAVSFRDLGLAIVDEQHRFGVHQRLAMNEKGEAPDMLVMTATPIPRTLVLTAFGDMEVSRLTEKPAGRRPIRTVTLPMERLGDLVARIREAVAEGQKVYWICPLVEESEEVDLTAAEDRYDDLQRTFPSRVGLVHGRMKGVEKDEAMRRFKAGETRLLVATTVIEVGVDVPDATIMVIEHAERFGLAQLHQLRGRVGRGSADSSCVLLYKEPLGETAKRRLSVMRETEDGFVIAEEDLKLRGEGEVLGTRQSGMPGFQMARLDIHGDLLALARDEARLALSRDPELSTDRGKALRLLLYLFGRDEAVRLLDAG